MLIGVIVGVILLVAARYYWYEDPSTEGLKSLIEYYEWEAEYKADKQRRKEARWLGDYYLDKVA